jgi:hypothetical protein
MATAEPEEPELAFPRPQRRLTAAGIWGVIQAYRSGATARELAVKLLSTFVPVCAMEATKPVRCLAP